MKCIMEVKKGQGKCEYPVEISDDTKWTIAVVFTR